jgi:hypothetical protein
VAAQRPRRRGALQQRPEGLTRGLLTNSSFDPALGDVQPGTHGTQPARARSLLPINRDLRMSRTAVWVALIAIVLVGLYLLQANGMIRF